MIELLSKIETILATAPNSQSNDELLSIESQSENVHSHPLTSWTGERIAQGLCARLPQAQGTREQEVLQAFRDQKYSRCKIYPQLVEGNAYIQAVVRLSSIPAAVEAGLLTLPTLFNESVHAILAAHDQKIASSLHAGKDRAEALRESTVTALERLAIDVFAKGLGDESEQ